MKERATQQSNMVAEIERLNVELTAAQVQRALFLGPSAGVPVLRTMPLVVAHKMRALACLGITCSNNSQE